MYYKFNVYTLNPVRIQCGNRFYFILFGVYQGSYSETFFNVNLIVESMLTSQYIHVPDSDSDSKIIFIWQIMSLIHFLQ